MLSPTSTSEGSGYWSGLPASARRDQLLAMAQLCEDRYPALRFYAFDARRVYFAPVTVFSAQLAVIYVGRVFTVFRRATQIRAMIGHFDGLVREATVEARRMSSHLQALADRVEVRTDE
jgi:hypothetical protein